MAEGCCETEGDTSYDLAILGGGSAAFAAALRGSELGDRHAGLHEGRIGPEPGFNLYSEGGPNS